MPRFSKSTNSKRHRRSDTPFRWMFERASTCPPANAIERHSATGSSWETAFTMIIIVGVIVSLACLGLKFGKNKADNTFDGRPTQTSPTAAR